jgi:hypothetical protein
MSKSVKTRLVFWSTPAFSVVMGVVYLAASWHSGHPWLGVGMLAIMLGFGGGLVVAAQRSETVRGLLDRRDERIVDIDLRATAAAGLAVILAVIAGAVVELARGHTGQPYIWLGAIAGVVYLGAVVVQRIRR